jgi:hypothetical protein
LIETFDLGEGKKGIKIVNDKNIIYSMDCYEAIDKNSFNINNCSSSISLKDITLCYTKLNDQCVASLILTKNSIEIISFRYFISKNIDSYNVDINQIYRSCMEMANKLTYKV